MSEKDINVAVDKLIEAINEITMELKKKRLREVREKKWVKK